MQTKMMSLAETALNYFTGFVIALAITYWVLPFWGFEPSPSGAVEITMLYTVVSIIRSYAWRRLFNWIHFRNSFKDNLKKGF